MKKAFIYEVYRNVIIGSDLSIINKNIYIVTDYYNISEVNYDMNNRSWIDRECHKSVLNNEIQQLKNNGFTIIMYSNSAKTKIQRDRERINF